MSEMEDLLNEIKSNPFITAMMKEVAEKAYQKGRQDAIDEFLKDAFDAEVTNGFGNKQIRYFIDVTEQIKEEKR